MVKVWHGLAAILLVSVCASFAKASCGGDSFDELQKGIDASAGKIKDFVPFFQPVFDRKMLEQNQARLKPGNNEFTIARQTHSRWVAESRTLSGSGKPTVVAVKYSAEMADGDLEVEKLKWMRGLFEELDIRKYFDVLVPHEVDPKTGAAIYPYLEARSLEALSKKANRITDSAIFGGGPPDPKTSPEVAKLWSTQQTRLKQVIKIFREKGYSVDVYRDTSTSGQRYISSISVMVDVHRNQYFSLSSDLLVTTEGRFVVSDPM